MPERLWTSADLPDQGGRTAVVTGGNGGLGFEVARVLAGHGARVVLACRDPAKGAAAVARIAAAGRLPAPEPEVVPLDLASLASVRAAATVLQDRFGTVDLLINNAGVMMTPYSRTEDGFELQFGTNHLGPFALTGLLLAGISGRIVTVSSIYHRRGRIDFGTLAGQQRGYRRPTAYAQSKLANLLFTYELQRRLTAAGRPAPIALAAHPGYASTELTRYLPAVLRLGSRLVEPVIAQSAEMGALPLLRAATDPAARGGWYYGPSGVLQNKGYPVPTRSSARSHDADLAARLWAESEKLTGVSYHL